MKVFVCRVQIEGRLTCQLEYLAVIAKGYHPALQIDLLEHLKQLPFRTEWP